jgi:hypothetical protein
VAGAITMVPPTRSKPVTPVPIIATAMH